MKYFDWDPQKNKIIKEERWVAFEDVLLAIGQGDVLSIIEHPNKDKYPSQRIFIVDIDSYAYLVPFVEDDEKIFLKTIIPSRKATKKYIINNN